MSPEEDLPPLRLPSNFNSVLDLISCGDIKIDSHIENGSLPEMRLRRNVVKCTTFSNDVGQIVIPSSFDIGEHTSLLDEHVPIKTDDSIASILFSHEIPLIGIISDFLRVIKDRKIALPQPKEPEEITWGEVIASLLHEMPLIDVNGYSITETASIASPIFKAKGEIMESPSPIKWNENTFLTNLYLFLSKYFVINFEDYTAIPMLKDAILVKLNSAQKAITPFVFNNCREGCRFCYVDRGLSQIYYPKNWVRDIAEIEAVLAEYDAESGVGHAQLRFSMMDWEPTDHPHFFEILKVIVRHDPKNQIPIVTHGGNLTEDLLRKIARDPDLKANVLFQVSLNSSQIEQRKALMPGAKNDHHKTAITSIELMHKLGINFDVSLVAATNWVPIEDILATLRYIDQFDTHSYIRVALPTATRHHPESLNIAQHELAKIDQAVTSMRGQLRNAVLTTVGLSNRKSLNAQVEDVVDGSVANLAGITHGSIIKLINGVAPRSRTDATSILLRHRAARNAPSLIIQLVDVEGKEYEIDLDSFFSKKNGRLVGEKMVGVYGLLLHDDVDFAIFREMKMLQNAHGINNPLMITSEIMLPFFNEALGKLEAGETVRNLQVMAAHNYFFGGNVAIAGLLTFEDLLRSMKEGKISNFDGVFISSAMLSRGGFDLTGRHVNEFSYQVKTPVFAIKSNTGSI